MPKTITDIIPPSRRRAMENMQETPQMGGMEDMTVPGSVPPPMPPVSHTPPSYDSGPVRGGKKKFPYAYAIAAVVVVLASIGLLFAFGGAKIEVTPVMKEVSVSGSFSATPSAGDLPYEVISVELSAEKEVAAAGEETVDLPAQGTITIYNGQIKVQELIKNTRFESSDNRIFRIRDSVQIPAGTATTPGQLQVTVYADAGGTAYNIGPSTFTLPGLASSAAFDLVYAKSDQPMSGGFSGTRPSVAASARAGEYESMKSGLDASLRKAIVEKVADTHVLLPGAVFLQYTPQPDADAASDKVKLVQKGTATAFVFPKESLAKAIASVTLGVYTGQPVTIRSSEGLTFSTEGGVTPSQGAETLPFTLTGNTELVWVVDTEEIKGAVAGKSRDAAKTILSGFSELAEVKLILKPFWTSTVPADPQEIDVIVKEPKSLAQ